MAVKLTAEQEALAQQLVQIGQSKNAGPKLIKSAIETALVESNLSNPSGGDADSAGWRQERASLYPNPTNIKASADRYYNEAQAVAGKYATAGALAAAVQRPAAQYRDRYQERAGDAAAILKQLGGAGGATTNTQVPVGATAQRTTTIDTTPDTSALAALGQKLSAQKTTPVAFAGLTLPDFAAKPTTAGVTPTPTTAQPQATDFQNLLMGLRTQGTGASSSTTVAQGSAQDTANVQTTTAAQATAAGPSQKQLAGMKGLATFQDKKVAAWIQPILADAKADGVKFSLSSGWRSDAEQKAIYDSGVRPAAKPQSEGGGGSNHEFKAFPGGAIDVGSGAAELSAWLQTSKYKNVLVYAGSKDPVHFSHPHNGSY